MKNPKTWDELLEAGYVIELSEEQIASFRDRTGQLDKNFEGYLSPQEYMERSNDREAKLRARNADKSSR